MDLQSFFYITGIIFMTLYTIILLVLVILLFILKKKISNFHETIKYNAESAKKSLTDPKRIAAFIGGIVVNIALGKAAGFIRFRRKR